MSIKLNGKLVRELRINKGWTVPKLAEQAGVSVESVKRIENTRSTNLTNVYIADYIAKALDVEVPFLYAHQNIPLNDAIDDQALAAIQEIVSLHEIARYYMSSEKYIEVPSLRADTLKLLEATKSLMGPFALPSSQLGTGGKYLID